VRPGPAEIGASAGRPLKVETFETPIDIAAIRFMLNRVASAETFLYAASAILLPRRLAR
jgi:hypothetical protein